MESREKQKMKIKKHAVSSMTGAYMESYEIISKKPRHISSADVPQTVDKAPSCEGAFLVS